MILICVGLLIGFNSLQPSVAGAGKKIVGEDHWVPSISAADGKPLKIYLWEKRLQDVNRQELAGSDKVVLLTHGATISSRVVFDLQVSQKSDPAYSLMDFLAERRFDVFSIDYQNYGRSNHHDCGLCVTTQVAANSDSANVLV
jgi:pimeloyl-ACP methyl ester carboxylesterase